MIVDDTALRAGEHALYTVVGPFLSLINGQGMLAHLKDRKYLCISIQNTICAFLYIGLYTK